jgi:hypothetical protein
MKPGDWERVFAGLLPQLYDDKWMYPIVIIQLLPNLIQIAGLGSSCLKTALTPHLESLENELEVEVNWIDPLDVRAPVVRRSATDILQVMPSLGPALVQAANEYKQLAAVPVGLSYEWVGWLCREKQDQWNCRLKILRNDLSADLCVMLPAGADVTSIEKIGVVNHGVVELDPLAAAHFVEGRPAFALKSVAPTSP